MKQEIENLSNVGYARQGMGLGVYLYEIWETKFENSKSWTGCTGVTHTEVYSSQI